MNIGFGRSVFAAVMLVSLAFSAIAAVGLTFDDSEVISIGGKWDMLVDAGGQVVNVTVEIEQKEKTFTGSMSTPFGDGVVKDGKIDGTKFEANVDLDFQGQPLALKMTGNYADGELKGSFEGPGVPPSTFSAKKAKKEESDEKGDN